MSQLITWMKSIQAGPEIDAEGARRSKEESERLLRLLRAELRLMRMWRGSRPEDT
jgi:hypothetical protein